MRETDFQTRCIDWVKKQYRGKLLAVNIHGGGYSNKGFPDLLVFGNGHAIAVELKSDSGYQLQPDQKVWRSRFRKSNTPHYVIKTFEDFTKTIEEEFNEA